MATQDGSAQQVGEDSDQAESGAGFTGQVFAAREQVAENLGTTYWSVDGHAWSSIRPDLPEHVVELVAPPVVVEAAPVRITARVTAAAAAEAASATETASTTGGTPTASGAIPVTAAATGQLGPSERRTLAEPELERV